MTPTEIEWLVKGVFLLGVFLGGYYLWKRENERFQRKGYVGHCPRCGAETAHEFREGKERMYCICERCGAYNDEYADQYERLDGRGT